MSVGRPVDGGRTGQRLVALALTGLAALSFPILSIAETDRVVVGTPVLVVYLFAVWAVMIAVIFVLIERRR